MASVTEDAIERAIRKALTMARPAMATNFVHPDWAMYAVEFRAFWGGTRLAGMSTVGKSQWPHVAPVEVTLDGDRFVAPAFDDSVRAADVRFNARLAIVTWDDAWHAAIVYGIAEHVSAGRATIRPTRIYAMRAPKGHPQSRL